MIIEILFGVVTLVFLVLYFVTSKSKRERIDFHGKHVLITGGSSGIGYELCIEAFKQGSHVSIIARNLERLNQIKNEIESIKKNNQNFSNQMVQIESVDIGKSFEETKQAIDRLVNKVGPIDILINNAGIFKCTEFSETPIKDFEDMMRVNYVGSVYCTKAVIDSMKSRRFGRIVFVSSQAGQLGVFGYSAYSSSKFALRGFAEVLQMELKPYNILVTLSFPPDTDTPGLATENLSKPEETKLIAETSGVASAKEVSNNIIASVKKGLFSSYFGFTGLLLNTLSCGTYPVTTFKEIMTQIFFFPLFRMIAIILLFNFDSTIKSCFKKKHSK